MRRIFDLIVLWLLVLVSVFNAVHGTWVHDVTQQLIGLMGLLFAAILRVNA